jgi:hypothetical protein
LIDSDVHRLRRVDRELVRAEAPEAIVANFRRLT